MLHSVGVHCYCWLCVCIVLYIVFSSSRTRHVVPLPPVLANITRVLLWKSYFFQSTIGHRPRTGCRQFLCANSSCFLIAPCVLPVWCSVTDGLPSCH